MQQGWHMAAASWTMRVSKFVHFVFHWCHVWQHCTTALINIHCLLPWCEVPCLVCQPYSYCCQVSLHQLVFFCFLQLATSSVLYLAKHLQLQQSSARRPATHQPGRYPAHPAPASQSCSSRTVSQHTFSLAVATACTPLEVVTGCWQHGQPCLLDL